MRKAVPLLTAGLSLTLAMVGCTPGGDTVVDSGPALTDAGPTTDSGHTADGGHDAGGATPDGGRDAASTTDAGTDTGSDAGSDAATDGGLDASASCSAQDLGTSVGLNLATGSNTAASDTGNRSCTGNDGGLDVTFAWTAPAAGMYTIDSDGTTYDTVIDVLDACGGMALGCDDDDGAGADSLVSLPLSAGQHIIIVLDAYEDDETGTYALSITLTATEICGDGVDNDRNGDTDCEDEVCSSDPSCIESNCTDGIDNDGDGEIDCHDSDCDGTPACIESDCTDGIDNDGDGASDCNDDDCAASGFCGEGGMCDNTMDDDGDGATDCADTECTCDSACFTPMIVCSAAAVPNLASALGDGVHTGTFTNQNCGTRSDASCGDGGAGADITFQWTAPAAGDYTFDTLDTAHHGGVFDTVLSVRTACTGGTELGCNDDDDDVDSRQSSVTLTLTAGQVVFIVVDSFNALEGGYYTLNIHAM